jgi:signal transduction histidine kinase
MADDPDQVSWVSPDVSPAVIVTAGLISVPILVLRDRAPAAASIVLSAHAALITVTIGSRPLVTLLVAVYSAAMREGRRRALLALAATLVAHSFAVTYEASFSGPGPRPFAVVAVALVYALLDLATWSAGRRSGAAMARAAHLESTRAALAREAVQAERQRIARELHDIVAHSVSLMGLRAAAARRMIASDPERATRALADVDTISHQAINELRRMLSLLDEGQPGEASALDTGDVSRLPDVLHGIDALVARVKESGRDVVLLNRGSVARLEPSVSLAVHRIVQEALTNAVKHGDPRQDIKIVIQWEDTQLVVCVKNHVAMSNDSDPSMSTGRGLSGLSERARLLGGSLDTRRLPGGVFELAAVLPRAQGGRTTGHVMAGPRDTDNE